MRTPPRISRSTWFEAGGLLLILVLFLAFCCTVASGRILWFDEFFTRQVLEQGSWSRILAALRRGLDLQPPFFYLLTRWTRFIGSEELGLRLPGILGFTFAGLFLYLAARRWFTPGYAVAAMLTPWIVFFQSLGIDARPYGLVLGFASLALLGWTYRDCWPRAGRIGYLAGILGACSVHYYGFLLAAPFGAAAAWTAIRERRWDLWTILGCVCAMGPDLWNYPLVHGAVALYKSGAWNPPKWSLLVSPSYGWPIAVAAAVYLTSLAGGRLHRSRAIGESDPDSETLVCWVGFCAIPIAAEIVARVISGMLVERYFCMYIPGYTLLLVYLLARAAAGARWVGNAAGSAAVMAFAVIALMEQQGFNAQWDGAALVCEQFANLLESSEFRQSRLMVGDSHLAMQLEHYCGEMRNRIVFGADAARAMDYLGGDSDKWLLYFRHDFPLDIEPLEGFVHQQQRELLVLDSGESFLKKYFSREPEFAGRFHLIDEGPGFALYRLDPVAH